MISVEYRTVDVIEIKSKTVVARPVSGEGREGWGRSITEQEVVVRNKKCSRAIAQEGDYRKQKCTYYIYFPRRKDF